MNDFYFPDPTVRWGDEIILVVSEGRGVTRDLLNVELPAPRVCLVSLHAEYVGGDVADVGVALFVGCGSQNTKLVRAFPGFPYPGTTGTLEAQWQLPLSSVRGRVFARGTESQVKCSLWLSPLFPVGGE